jgi:hypothetical protein
MSNSDLEIKIIQRINMIAGKMIEAGVSIPVALYIAKYTSSLDLSLNKREELFDLMNKWEKEETKTTKDSILKELISIVENCRNKILSSDV